MNRQYYLTLLLCIGTFLFSRAQPTRNLRNENADTTDNRQLQLTFDYLSNKTYLGQQNIITEKYLSPAISYYAPSGFFTAFALTKIIDPENRFDEADLSLGWSFKVLKDAEASLSYSRFSYSKQSLQLGSSLQNNFEVAIKRDGVITPALFFDMFFGKGKPDFGVRLDVYHDFEMDNLFTNDKDELLISPTVSIIAATLNFYTLYLRDSSLARTRQNIGVNVDSNFQLASIELSLPVEYDLGRFMIKPEIRHTIPLQEVRNSDNKAATYFNLSLGFFLMDE